MSDYHQIPLRSARNQVIDLLGANTNFGSSLPLQDLPLVYHRSVNPGKPTKILILGAQRGIVYKLCEFSGKIINSVGNEPALEVTDITSLQAVKDHLGGQQFVIPSPFGFAPGIDLFLGSFLPKPLNLLPEEGAPDRIWIDFIDRWKRIIVLTTPVMTEAKIFTVLASKGDSKSEVYLNQSVSIGIGIDETRLARFAPVIGGQSIDKFSLQVGFNVFFDPKNKNPMALRVENSQEGVTYQIVERLGTKETPRSAELRGSGTMIDLTLNSFVAKEDTTFWIKATMGASSTFLSQTLQLQVSPDPNPKIVVLQNALNYSESAQLRVFDYQETAGYQVYAFQLPKHHQFQKTERLYSPDGLPEPVLLNHIQALNTSISNQLNEITLTPVSEVQDSEHKQIDDTGKSFILLSTPALKEDCLLIVKAIKKKTELTWFLSHTEQISIIRISPNPAISLRVVPPQSAAGERVWIVVSEPQEGAAYYIDKVDQTPEIPLAAMHPTDRLIGWSAHKKRFGMRIGVDFIVGEQSEKETALPTMPLDQSTQFIVQAIKDYTGLEAVLTPELPVEARVTRPALEPVFPTLLNEQGAVGEVIIPESPEDRFFQCYNHDEDRVLGVPVRGNGGELRLPVEPGLELSLLSLYEDPLQPGVMRILQTFPRFTATGEIT